MTEARAVANSALALNRDVLWLERQLRCIARATAVNNPDRLRLIAAKAVETAAKRRKRTMTRAAL